VPSRARDQCRTASERSPSGPVALLAGTGCRAAIGDYEIIRRSAAGSGCEKAAAGSVAGVPPVANALHVAGRGRHVEHSIIPGRRWPRPARSNWTAGLPGVAIGVWFQRKPLKMAPAWWP
jgi:hypothetical protein